MVCNFLVIHSLKSQKGVRYEERKKNAELTKYRVSVVDILDTHLDVLNAEVHFQLLKPQVLAALVHEWLGPDEDFGLYTVCK